MQPEVLEFAKLSAEAATCPAEEPSRAAARRRDRVEERIAAITAESSGEDPFGYGVTGLFTNGPLWNRTCQSTVVLPSGTPFQGCTYVERIGAVACTASGKTTVGPTKPAP